MSDVVNDTVPEVNDTVSEAPKKTKALPDPKKLIDKVKEAIPDSNPFKIKMVMELDRMKTKL